MKLALDLDGEQFEADFASTNGRATLTLKGVRHEADVSQPEAALFVIIREGHVYRCQVDRLSSGSLEIDVNGRRFAVKVRDLKHLRGNNGSGAVGAGSATLTAPMPGKVVRVLCATGDEVVAGQGVLVVEAMKMQNEVQAPRAGKVVEIRVRDGQTVNSGEVLAVIE